MADPCASFQSQSDDLRGQLSDLTSQIHDLPAPAQPAMRAKLGPQMITVEKQLRDAESQLQACKAANPPPSPHLPPPPHLPPSPGETEGGSVAGGGGGTDWGINFPEKAE